MRSPLEKARRRARRKNMIKHKKGSYNVSVDRTKRIIIPANGRAYHKGNKPITRNIWSEIKRELREKGYVVKLLSPSFPLQFFGARKLSC